MMTYWRVKGNQGKRKPVASGVHIEESHARRLFSDFVEGTRNHVNAGQAMLLYMQRTWNDLAMSPAVSDAMLSGYATQKHLMAAGYNSNPARLTGYLNRGGENWAT